MFASSTETRCLAPKSAVLVLEVLEGSVDRMDYANLICLYRLVRPGSFPKGAALHYTSKHTAMNLEGPGMCFPGNWYK